MAFCVFYVTFARQRLFLSMLTRRVGRSVDMIAPNILAASFGVCQLRPTHGNQLCLQCKYTSLTQPSALYRMQGERVCGVKTAAPPPSPTYIMSLFRSMPGVNPHGMPLPLRACCAHEDEREHDHHERWHPIGGAACATTVGD
jgi:hypothetical protein